MVARWQQAEAIRSYVLEADRSRAAKDEDYAGWRRSSPDQADAIDPLMDGSAPFERLPPLTTHEP